MKTKRWAKTECLLTLSLKLSEECAEVGKEITKAPFRKKGLNKEALLAELAQVEVIAAIMKERIHAA